MKRALIATCVALLIVAAGAQAETQQQAGLAAAHRDAKQLLGRLRLPEDVTRIAKPPSYTTPLATEGTPVGTPIGAPVGPQWATAAAYWTTDARPRRIIDYVAAHVPAGVLNETTGYGSNSANHTKSLDVEFVWRPVGKLQNRSMSVTVVTPPHGASTIVAVSQSQWMAPRPRSEQIPTNVRAVAVTLRIGSGPGGMTHQHAHTYRFTNAARVTSIVNAFDALPITQPGLAYSCPAQFAHMPLLTLRFVTAAGSMVARAQVDVYPGTTGSSGSTSCDPIDFWIGSRWQTPLTSQTFVKHIARLIDANIS